MRLIDFLCDIVTQNKNPDIKILRRFFCDRWLTFDELRKGEKFNYYIIKRLVEELVKRNILIEESYSWKTGTNLHKRNGTAITKGKKWKINKDNKIVKILMQNEDSCDRKRNHR